MVSRYRQTEPVPAGRLPLWGLLDQIEHGARVEAGPLAEDESSTTHFEMQRQDAAPVPGVILCLIRSALVALPGPNNDAEIYGHNPGREWEYVCNLPAPVGEQLAEVLFAFAASHWQKGGRL